MVRAGPRSLDALSALPAELSHGGVKMQVPLALVVIPACNALRLSLVSVQTRFMEWTL